MINLMYFVLMAMLALNVSSDVLKGFTMIGESLKRTTGNALSAALQPGAATPSAALRANACTTPTPWPPVPL